MGQLNKGGGITFGAALVNSVYVRHAPFLQVRTSILLGYFCPIVSYVQILTEEGTLCIFKVTVLQHLRRGMWVWGFLFGCFVVWSCFVLFFS